MQKILSSFIHSWIYCRSSILKGSIKKQRPHSFRHAHSPAMKRSSGIVQKHAAVIGAAVRNTYASIRKIEKHYINF